jgi:UDP:flavonoid glycosyltransferase YjiC (YdhE family)
LRSGRQRAAPLDHRRGLGYGLAVARIAVVHVPFYSHINAATRLTAVLAAQGHEVIAWAPEPCRRRIEAAGAGFQLHEPDMPRVDGFMGWVATLAESTEVWARDLVQELFAHDVDLIVHDSQVPWARVAGEYLGLPRIVSHPMFPIISNHQTRSDADWE